MSALSSSGPITAPVSGAFWLPDEPERIVRGELRASYERIDLDLRGVLGTGAGEDDPGTRRSIGHKYDLIHGHAGGLVTLGDCYFTQEHRAYVLDPEGDPTRRRVSVPDRQYMAMRMLQGAHLRRFELTGLWLELEHLQDWVGPRFAKTEDLPDGGVRIEQSGLPTLTGHVPGGRVSFQRVVHVTSSSVEGAQLSYRNAFVVEPDAPIDLDAALDRFVRPLRGFMTLATGRASVIKEFSVRPSADAVINGQDIADKIFHPCYFPTSPGIDQGQNRHYNDPFFRLHDIEANFGDVIARWFDLHETLGPALALFTDQFHAPPRQLELQFLLTAMTAEVLHARLHPGQRRPLRARVHELIDAAPEIVRVAIGDLDLFARDVTKTRNHFTHWNDRAAVGTVHDVYERWLKLQLLVATTILGQVGFAESDLTRFIRSSRLFADAKVAATAQRL